MSIFGLDSGYTVKYNPLPLPLRTPSGKGLYLTVYPSSRPNTDTVISPPLPPQFLIKICIKVSFGKGFLRV